MPLKNVDLKQFMRHTFVETGTWKGDGIEAALRAGFKQAYTMDIDGPVARKTHSLLASRANVEMRIGKSVDVLPAMLAAIADGVTFWLDAHPEGLLSLDEGVDGRLYAPLLRELDIIKQHTASKVAITVLIDDMRLFTPEDRLRLSNKLKSIRDNMAVRCIDGHAANDILVGEC